MPDKKEKKKKAVKVSSDEVDKSEESNTGSASNTDGTLFLMDLLRQKTEKARREKKDEVIRRMALEQKQRKEQGIPKTTTYPSMGGFVGINALKGDGSKISTPYRKRKEQPPTVEEEKTHAQGDTQMFIMGLLQEQSQQQRDREHLEVNEKSLLCPSDESQFKNFCN